MNKKEKIHMLIDYTPNEAYEKRQIDGHEIEITTDIIEALGSEEIKAIGIPDQIKLEIRFNGIQKPHIYYQYIKGFVSALVTEDPTKVHYDIIRATLKKIDTVLLEDKNLIDTMARELIEQCRKLNLMIKIPESIQLLFNKTTIEEEKFPALSGRVPFPLKVIKLNITHEEEYLFEKDNMFIWDKEFLNLVKNIERKNNNAIKQYQEGLEGKLSAYKNGSQRPVDFWFNTKNPTPEEPFHTSPALQILTKHIYENIIKKREEYSNKFPPLLPNKIHSSVNILHKGKIKETEEQIQYLNEGHVIGSLSIATIDQNLYDRILRGADKFRTVTAHRLFRFLPQQAHNQLANGINPCNILTYPGGYAQIAEELGLNGKKVISDLKDLLHGLAFMQWTFQDFTGNFITLGQYKQAITRNQNPGIKITLGPELTPYYAKKHRELLIPILKDPQLVGPTQYYANQYLLQNEIMAEFSNQSVRLTESGVVILTEDIWERGGLPKRIKNLVKECWTQDENNGEQFLEEVEKNAFTLGPSYHKELKFLKEQGERRKQRSDDARRAIEKKNRRYPSSK